MDTVEPAQSYSYQPTDDFYQDDEYEEEVFEQRESDSKSQPFGIAGITTATAIFSQANDSEQQSADDLPNVDPGVFKIGMPVIHPEHGPGKVVALSGSGKNRTATINYAAGAGQRTVVLKHSPVRPIGS